MSTSGSSLERLVTLPLTHGGPATSPVPIDPWEGHVPNSSVMMTANYWRPPNSKQRYPDRVTFSVVFGTREEADAFMAIFPKYCKFHCKSKHGLHHVYSRTKLSPDMSNGGQNRAGIYRVRAILRHARMTGILVEFHVYGSNSYESVAALLRAIE